MAESLIVSRLRSNGASKIGVWRVSAYGEVQSVVTAASSANVSLATSVTISTLDHHFMNQAIARAHPGMLLSAAKARGRTASIKVDDVHGAPLPKTIATSLHATYRATNAQGHGVAIASELLLIALFAAAAFYLPSQKNRAPEPQALTVHLHAERPKPQTPLPAQAEPPPQRIIQPVFVPPPSFDIATTETPITQVTYKAPVAVTPIIRVAEPPQPSVDVLTAYQVLLRAAVQNAILYPVAARAAGIRGNTRVAFDFRDGRVSNFEILQSSGSTIIDRAAIAAVSSAAIPQPPVELSGRQFRFAIVVNFSLGSA
jgi:protein TonB